MKVTWFQKVKWYVQMIFAKLVFKLKHPTTQYKITPRGEALLEYCIKVLSSENGYEPEGYAEYLADEAIKKVAEKENLSTEDAAKQILLAAFVSGAVNNKSEH